MNNAEKLATVPSVRVSILSELRITLSFIASSINDSKIQNTKNIKIDFFSKTSDTLRKGINIAAKPYIYSSAVILKILRLVLKKNKFTNAETRTIKDINKNGTALYMCSLFIRLLASTIEKIIITTKYFIGPDDAYVDSNVISIYVNTLIFKNFIVTIIPQYRVLYI